MYFTHHFAHHETLSRAHSWLTRLGFKPHPIGAHRKGTARLALSIRPQQWGQVSLLINAVERTDPDGFPSFWDQSRQPHVSPETYPEATPIGRRQPGSAVIGWHPLD